MSLSVKRMPGRPRKEPGTRVEETCHLLQVTIRHDLWAKLDRQRKRRRRSQRAEMEEILERYFSLPRQVGEYVEKGNGPKHGLNVWLRPDLWAQLEVAKNLNRWTKCSQIEAILEWSFGGGR